MKLEIDSIDEFAEFVRLIRGEDSQSDKAVEALAKSGAKPKSIKSFVDGPFISGRSHYVGDGEIVAACSGGMWSIHTTSANLTDVTMAVKLSAIEDEIQKGTS